MPRHPSMPVIPREERFWRSVDRSGGPDACWPWLKGRIGSGYGVFAWNTKRGEPSICVNSHRAAWMLTHGDIPDGMFVCHRCDNPICVNPRHLWLGSPGDNVRDTHRKGRAVPAPRKLTDEQVQEMRFLARYGVTQKALADQFGVHQGYVSRVLSYHKRAAAGDY